MSIIKLLPENLVNQIAAGEVVERPASVVKELVENSLDAGADQIVIEIREGGKTLVKVSDNGKGMSREDCEMALQRHATSKIGSEADLWKINTMGFRGEALASIASVSKLRLKSKRSDDLAGTQLDCNGGDLVSLEDVGMSAGTQVEVHDLFFNTPARQKYLKKDSSELGHITSLMNGIALANVGVGFKVIHNDRSVMDLPKVDNLLVRIGDVFGQGTAEAMIEIFYGGTDYKLEGYIGKPLLSRSTSKYQFFLVNGRPIQHPALANAIQRAYHSMLMENRKPVFVLNIEIDPALIDVNVHPRKLEVRFEDQQNLVRVVYGAVKAALERTDLTPKGFTESKRYMADKFPENEPSASVSKPVFGAPSLSAKPSMSFSPAVKPKPMEMDFREARSDLVQEDPSPKIRPILQIANSYIVAEDADGLVLIDQHAAHERVRYEQLMDQFENQEKSVQSLLTPLQIEFTAEEKNLVEENIAVFNELGFEIEHFGGNTFVIQAVPAFLSDEDIDDVVRGVLDDITNDKSPGKAQGRKEEILTYMSCRSAIKFGQSLSISEMEALMLQMERLRRPYTCPHGRPTMVSLTLSELEKMFGRK